MTQPIGPSDQLTFVNLSMFPNPCNVYERFRNVFNRGKRIIRHWVLCNPM